MRRRRNWGIIAIIALLVALLAITISHRQWRRFSWVEIGDQRYRVVLSVTSEERQQGLSDRDRIGADGMLFINPTREQSQFWMYHMKFPLDFVWIADGKVVDLHQNVPAPTGENDIVRLQPVQPADMVIEFPSGTIGRENITIGTRVNRVLNWYFSLW